MSERTEQDINIKDLPAEKNLTPEEKERLAGAGRFRPTFEVLETRQLMSVTGFDTGRDTTATSGGAAHVGTIETSTMRIEMPAETSGGGNGSLSAMATTAPTTAAPSGPLGPVDTVHTLKGGIDQNGNLIPGSSDISAAAVYTTANGTKYLFTAGDEDQSIRLYKFNVATGEYDFVKRWDFTNDLGLSETAPATKIAREVDIEAVTMSGSSLYWIGSGSNRGDEHKDAPNRDRIFKTDIVVNASGQPDLVFKGSIQIEEALKNQFAGLKTAAAPGVDPKTIAGYNIEGLVKLPDNTMGIAFRASGVDPSGAGRALIIPVKNLDAMITNGEPAQFGDPMRLDLGGRGIRDIMGSKYTDAGGAEHWQFLIVAGPAGAASGIGDDDFRLYTWTGNAADAPVMHSANLLGLTPEAIVLPEGNTKWDANTRFGLISDCGAMVFDNNKLGKDQDSKDKQSRIDFVTLGDDVMAGGFFRKDLSETRRQGFLKGPQEFTFTASSDSGYLEVLGADMKNMTLEVTYAYMESSAFRLESSYNATTGENRINLTGLEPGRIYTVRIIPTYAPTLGEYTRDYTLSWQV